MHLYRTGAMMQLINIKILELFVQFVIGNYILVHRIL